MSTAPERRALALIAAVAALGVAARAWRGAHSYAPPTPAEVRALDAQIARIDSARTAARTARAPRRAPARASRPSVASREVRPGSTREPGRTSADSASRAPVDLDRASRAEIEALPWIGPALSERIIQSREKCGPFGSLQGLTRVYGIGDATAKRLAPYVTFSGAPRPMGAATAPGCASAAKHAAPRSRGRSK